MARSVRKAKSGIIWRHQSVPEEWALQADLRSLAIRIVVAARVSARQGGVCCWEGCTAEIVSYPHAIPWPDGANDEINRAGVCQVHRQLLNSDLQADGPHRRYLQEWLKRYYAETAGLAPEVWEAIARGRPPADLEVAAGCQS